MDIVTTPTATTTRTRRFAYRFLTAVPALLVALFGGRLLIAGWFATTDGGSHRLHDLSWGVLEGVVILVGLVASLWRPRRWPPPTNRSGSDWPPYC
ncbi:hypothetical protein BH20ACT8_BH20ACT8_07240 [soil metagenome]